ncbi:oxygen-insensitive NADPH nitroreductase [Paenibacillus beijingensis]|uniref:Nitroreductase domain-containing protein n=1 Tax=Paenibacillus beijingensis TaxID=1126833 RepID=A0A0D5NMC9_9BACL|nr:oxygen-insensitive NADPH nitroreductase [Paenibacillus beijingensis]AJY76127.1 hypothetical protein VN24_18140 [Paenibacillus beijingensis]
MLNTFSNETIEALLHHRSIRRYKNEPVTRSQLELILRCAQQASSSSHMQTYSVISVTEPDKRRAIAAWAGGQRHVEQAPVFLVWCADLHRFDQAVAGAGGQFEPSLEYFLVATVDVSLAAQNAVIAAESMGLGAVYIGGIRNEMKKVAGLLELPELVYPVFGLCIGVPDEQPDLRPRLPQEAVFHENRYNRDAFGQTIEAYDKTYHTYASSRSGGTKDTTWSIEMRGRTKYPPRQYGDFLRDQRFKLDDGQEDQDD